MAERSAANAVARGQGTSHPRHRERASVQGEFLQANRALRAEIEGLEAKIRRRDVVVDEERQVDFYRARLPERVNSVAAFNHWRVEAERANPRLLYMSRAELMQRDAQEAGADRFPDELPVGGNQLPLLYKFEPAEPADGVTLIVPEPLLDVVSSEQIAWLVPGMRLEKIIAVFRELPKSQRKLLVPVPDFAKSALDDLAVDAARLGRLPGFHEWLSQWITQRVGATVTPLELAALPLPDYLRMNLRVLDADDQTIAEGRDLLAIKRRLYAAAPGALTGALGVSQSAAFSPHGMNAGLRETHEREPMRTAIGARGGSGVVGGKQADARGAAGAGVSDGSRAGGRGGAGVSDVSRAGASAAAGVRTGATSVSAAAVDIPLHRQWDFGDVPERREVERNRLRLVVYPAIEDRVSGVALIEARNAPTAEAISRAGVVRLAMLGLPQQAKYVTKRVTDDRDLILLSRGLTLRQSLPDAVTQRAFRECFLPADVPLPRTAHDFKKMLDDRRAQLSEVADRLVTTITSTLKEWRAVRAALDGLHTGSFADVVAEVNAQLSLLLPPDFIESTPRPWLDYLPRYLKAIARRIERLPSNVRRDAELSAKVKPFAAALRTFMAEPAISGLRLELEELRWMIEEFRVSLFAQELKTMIRVSEKRLEEQVRLVRESQR